MSVQLHCSPLSQPSRAVQWFMLLNGIKFDSHVIKNFPADMQTPEFKTMNPFSTIPTIKDTDGTCVYESNAIAYYLREKYNDKAGLLPVPASGDLHQRTRIVSFMYWYTTGLRLPIVGFLFPTVVAPAFLGAAPPSEEVKAALMVKVNAALKNMNDQWLSHPGYIGGSAHPTLADLQCISEIEQLRMYPAFDWSPFPNVQRYREHMSKVAHWNDVFGPLVGMFSKPAQKP